MKTKEIAVPQAEPKTPYFGIKIIFNEILAIAPIALKIGIQVVISFLVHM